MRRVLLISLLTLPLSVTEAYADVVVIVRREAEAAGNYIRVCDVARVEGPREQAAEVGLTVLGPTPPKGQPMEISRWDIESRLCEMGIGQNVTFSGNDTVRVSGNGLGAGAAYAENIALNPLAPMTAPAETMRLGEARDVSPPKPAAPAKSSLAEPGARAANPLDSMPEDAKTRIGLIVSHFLASRYRRPDVEIESTLLSVTDAIPYSAHEVSVTEAVAGQVPGKATLKLRVRDTPDAPPREITVAADTQLFALAPVAAKQLYKGEILAARDVVVKRVQMKSGQGYLPPNPKAVEGRELVRNMAPGEPLLANEALPTQAVMRGDMVENVASSRGWMVQSTGKALAGGSVGDVITVEDSSTKAKYQARIVGRGVVSVISKKRI